MAMNHNVPRRSVMRSAIAVRVFSIAFLFFGCTGIPKGLHPVTGFEPDKYLGRWYEIARLDHSFERDLIHVSADYAKRKEGGISVLNRGYNLKTEKWKAVKGVAYFTGSETVGSLKVSFFGPFYGGYHIIALDKKQYQYAMVAGPNRSYLWILSRDKSMDAGILSDLVSKAEQWGFDTDKLVYVEHSK